MDCCSYPHFNPRIESEHCTVEASRASEKKEKEKKDKERKEREPASAAGVSLCFYLFFLFVSNRLGPVHTPSPRERGGLGKKSLKPLLDWGPKSRNPGNGGPNYRANSIPIGGIANC
jgi:hypothetical protein